MNHRSLLLTVVLMLGASPLAVGQRPSDPARLFPWSDVKAISDADAAINAGELYLYWTGGIACGPAVAREELELAWTLPKRYIACGCIVDDLELRLAQMAYAQAFNQRILDNLRSRQ